MSYNNQKKIAVINDFCGFGRCSITASLPIISAMGIQCCPLPTAIFSNHTGYESFYRTDYTDHMNGYMDEWKKLDLHFDGILSGYLASPDQIEIVKSFFEKFKKEDTVILIDPVMGDNGRLYPAYSSTLSEKMKELLAGDYRDVPVVTYGPFEAPVYKVENKYRMRMVIKCRLNKRSRALFDALLRFFSGSAGKGLTLSVDFNPSSL